MAGNLGITFYIKYVTDCKYSHRGCNSHINKYVVRRTLVQRYCQRCWQCQVKELMVWRKVTDDQSQLQLRTAESAAQLWRHLWDAAAQLLWDGWWLMPRCLYHSRPRRCRWWQCYELLCTIELATRRSCRELTLSFSNGCRTPGNGRRALILKRHLLSGQRPRQFVRIAPGLGKNFQNLSGPPYTPYFSSKLIRINRIWPKIAAEKVGDLRNAGIKGLGIEITINRQIFSKLYGIYWYLVL
jgi:hypothetical protein